MQPNYEDIFVHLTLLYEWARNIDCLIEVRCLHPKGKVKSQRFKPTDLTAVANFAITANQEGYNLYSVPALLKPTTVNDATDLDILCAKYHLLDADDNDIAALDAAITANGFAPYYKVQTGTVPKPRMQIAWRLAEPNYDLKSWSHIQTNLAAYYNTDSHITNPSRLMRLAGTVSYPVTRKIARGYIEELTTLIEDQQTDILNSDFYNAFPEVAKMNEEPEIDPQFREDIKSDFGDVPLYVLQAAFLVIPPSDDRDLWRNLGYAAKEANASEGFAPWTEWSKNSRKFDRKDQIEQWKSFKPSIIDRSYIFKKAKDQKQFWWRDHGIVEKWMQESAKAYDEKKTETIGSFSRNFEMTERGLFYISPPKKEGEAPERHWLSNPFKVLGRTSNATGTGYGILIAFRSGETAHEVIITADDLHKTASSLGANLADKGLRVETKNFCRELLQQALNNVEVKRKFLSVKQTGWYQTHDNQFAFILPDRTLVGDGNVVLQADAMPGCKAVGKLTDWQAEIGAYLVGNSRLSFFTCAALASPLLQISNEGSAAFHLHGHAKNGKTTALAVASSIWGKGDNRGGYVKTWEATSTGLEHIAAASSDCLLPLDELSQAPAAQVSGIIYKLINGTGRTRGKAQGGIRDTETWRILLLSTGEETPEQRINENVSQHANAGINVRVIVIPADAGAAKDWGVIENLHGFASSAELVGHLMRASTRTYGTPIRVFLDKLVALRNSDELGLRDAIKDHALAFRQKYVPANANGQVISVANKFALVAFAGNLAQAFGILPANLQPEPDAATCFAAWLEERGDIGASEHSTVIRTVRQFIQAHGESRFQRIPKNEFAPVVHNRVGFKVAPSYADKDYAGPFTWYILCDQMGEIVKTMNERSVGKILHKAGCVEQGSINSIKRIGRFFGEKHRVYKLYSKIFDADAETTDDTDC